MRNIFIAAVAAAVLTVPSVASAQAAGAEKYIGLSAGYHNLDIADELEDGLDDFDISDSSSIFGVFAGVDVPLGSSLFAGLEGNYHLGTDAIDSEYGASARFGLRSQGGAKFYARGGYQHVDFDVSKILGEEVDDAFVEGDSDSDYLVGLGADLPLGRSILRANLDTVSFDTLRATAGFAFGF